MTKEKVKKESNFKKKINEMKKTPKGRAILKLIGWAIFFVALLAFCLISSLIAPTTTNDTPEDKEQEPAPVVDDNIINEQEIIKNLQTNLLNSNYDYIYEISINDETYTFEGNKINDIDSGYKTTSSGIIKYYIDSTGIYSEFNNEKTLIDNLYENINVNYLDLNYLFNTVNALEMTEDNCDCVYPVYVYKDDINTYKISLKEFLNSENNNISSIEVSSNNYNYNLTFRNIEVK